MNIAMYVLLLFMSPILEFSSNGNGTGGAGGSIITTQIFFATKELCETAADQAYRSVDQLYGNSGFHPKATCVKVHD